ncbi:MAG: hypothetical protein OEQ29_23335 [Alphaproteobacteria bacterium]|nr:hypothetical protein [Alphaproteobacteria bacterium]
MNPAPTGQVKGAQLTDRELIKALRDRVRPADGDPVDVVDVRSDASDVVKFADIIDEIGTEASRAQQTKAELGEALADVAALRDLVEDDALGALSPEESEDLGVRLNAFAARTGEAILKPNSEAPQQSAEGTADGAAGDVEAAGSGEAAEAPTGDFHFVVDARLEAAQSRLQDERRAVAAREREIVERADRLGGAAETADAQSVVRLALETAQRIAADRTRAISAQADRLEAQSVDALRNG